MPARPLPRPVDAARWIALNDDPMERDLDVIADQISVVMAADLFGIGPKNLAAAVLAHRREQGLVS